MTALLPRAAQAAVPREAGSHVLPCHRQGLFLTNDLLLLLKQHVLFMPKSVLLAASTSSKCSPEWASWVHPRKSFISLREVLCNALKPSLIFNGASLMLKHRPCAEVVLLLRGFQAAIASVCEG